MKILITNDDGIHAPGLAALNRAMEPLGEVTIVAPETPKSGVSQAITLHDPLRLRKIGERKYCVSGTPTDCVNLAILELMPERPDLVVSGINAGPNLGDDIAYSGTVAGAMEGIKFKIPSIAFSLATYSDHDFSASIMATQQITQIVLNKGGLARVALNVNFPPVTEFKGIRLVRHGIRIYTEQLIKRQDPFKQDYYWLGADGPHDRVPETGTDFEAVEEGYIAITPLNPDRNDPEALRIMKEWSW